MIRRIMRWFSSPTWADVSNQTYATPRQICSLVRHHVRYASDGGAECWQAPGVTWASARGDCEDYAVLIAELCRLSGHHAEIKVLWPGASETRSSGAKGHAIVWGRLPGGDLWYASNGFYHHVYDTSVDDHAAVRLGWRIGETVAMSPTTETIAQLIAKSTVAAFIAVSLSGCGTLGAGGAIIIHGDVHVTVSTLDAVQVRDNTAEVRR